MRLENFFYKGIEEGKKGDSRTKNEIDLLLKEEKERYDKLIGNKKKFYDLDKLKNPYSDSRIFFDSKKDINRILVGIDMEIAEILLGDKLEVDLILAHHPEGFALLKLSEVMDIHNIALSKAGIPINISEKLVSQRQGELNRKLSGINHNRSVDAAKLFNISYANLHSPADNLANSYIQNRIDNEDNLRLKDIVEMVYDIYEYTIAAKQGSIPKIISGDENSQAGKTFVKFNGGTSGNKNIFKYFEMFNISTIVCMHLPENQLELAKKHNVNAIVMPHMASDSLGMNLLLRNILRNFKENIEIISTSGYILNIN